MKARAHVFIIAACIALMAGTASGQDGWTGTAGLIHLQDAGTVGKGKLVFSLGTSYYKRGETLTKGTRSLLNPTDMIICIESTLCNSAVSHHRHQMQPAGETVCS